MSRVNKDPIEALSPSGAYWSVLAFIDDCKKKPLPAATFCLLMALWGAALCRCAAVALRFQPYRAVDVCLDHAVLVQPSLAHWQRLTFHMLWPFEPDFLRGAMITSCLLVLGYGMELVLGSAHFLGLFLVVHFLSSFLMLYFNLTACHLSIEATIVGLAVMMHRLNPVIAPETMDKSVRVPFHIETRWHLWAIQSCLILYAQNLQLVLTLQAMGAMIGIAYIMRHLDSWSLMWQAFRVRSPNLGRAIHVGVLLMALSFMPFNLKADLFSAISDGTVFTRTWWENLPRSPPVLHTASGPVLVIVKLMYAFAAPLVLSPYRMTTLMRSYSVLCVVLMMYLIDWHSYPHLALLLLAYLVWAFWSLPDATPSRD